MFELSFRQFMLRLAHPCTIPSDANYVANTSMQNRAKNGLFIVSLKSALRPSMEHTYVG